MIKLKRVNLYYSDLREEYSMSIAIGDEIREVSFKMDDKQTRKAIIPLLEAFCEACELSASELKRDVIAAVNGDEVEK